MQRPLLLLVAGEGVGALLRGGVLVLLRTRDGHRCGEPPGAPRGAASRHLSMRSPLQVVEVEALQRVLRQRVLALRCMREDEPSGAPWGASSRHRLLLVAGEEVEALQPVLWQGGGALLRQRDLVRRRREDERVGLVDERAEGVEVGGGRGRALVCALTGLRVEPAQRRSMLFRSTEGCVACEGVQCVKLPAGERRGGFRV